MFLGFFKKQLQRIEKKERSFVEKTIMFFGIKNLSLLILISISTNAVKKENHGKLAMARTS